MGRDLNRLARFDGVHFENVSLPRVGAAFYTTLIRSRDGGLWLGMHRGTVVCLNGKAVRVLTNGLAAGDVQSFTEDAEGAVWTTFRGGAVCRIENDRVTTFGASEGLSHQLPLPFGPGWRGADLVCEKGSRRHFWKRPFQCLIRGCAPGDWTGGSIRRRSLGGFRSSSFPLRRAWSASGLRGIRFPIPAKHTPARRWAGRRLDWHGGPGTVPLRSHRL